MAARIDAFLELLVRQGGSDLHLVADQPPRLRIHGAIQSVHFRVLDQEELSRMLGEILTPRHKQEFEHVHAVDFAYETEELGRFRVNVYQQLTGPAAAFRSITGKVKSLEELGIPAAVGSLIRQPSGLTVVTGPTGSGKSTTLSAMIDHINSERRGHIITIEDPIEFRHSFKKCVITQREVGLHSPTFAEALRNALHEDPDVILVGEMRDLETMSLALTAAETGVQVFGTLHTNGAVRTIDRIVNVFPSERQDLVRAMLSENLRMVVAQQLVPTTNRDGRVAVREILVNNSAASSLIRGGKTHQLASVLQSGRRLGMMSMDAQLNELVQNGTITPESAREYSLEKGRSGGRVAA
ncbi:MAG: PilT/PilU family type 4a pilus ATPase [Candidatus Eisenbacteria bacterium]|uniref:PilT/PilU family type 4a pilus ATPase n=1 Tax=Eiseniibacteriota bacterium TaxID=2212470 RepID=A0A956SE40_UNCEI|nr:PilT/PilU family type 4a pilus ATPase [Candidatus Eisenbacteria bacterium]MCB9464372.1 PilT/PilU family type 4a pilus ATPase [Candidatus Eisenbacteria bacterium]